MIDLGMGTITKILMRDRVVTHLRAQAAKQRNKVSIVVKLVVYCKLWLLCTYYHYFISACSLLTISHCLLSVCA